MTAFRHPLLRSTGTGHVGCTRNIFSPWKPWKNRCPREDPYCIMRKSRSRSCWPGHALHCAARSRDTGWLCPRAGSMKSLSWCCRTSTPLVFAYRRPPNVAIFQGAVIGSLPCSSAERVSNARPRPTVLNGRRENYVPNLVGSFLHTCVTPTNTVISHQGNPWAVGEGSTRQI